MSEEKKAVDFEPGTCIADGDILHENESDLVKSLRKEIKSKNNKKNRKSRWIKGICWFLSILIISGAIGYTGLTFVFDFLGFGNSKKIDVNIPQGSSAAQISQILEDEGVVRSGLMFRLFSKIKGYDAKFKYGVYVFSSDMSYERLAKKLTTEGEKAEAIKVVIPEGATVDEIAEKLEKYGVCSVNDFKKALRHDDYDYEFLKGIPDNVYYKLEGYLYPDTYYFYNYGGEECAHRAIDKMLANFDEKFTYELRQAAADRGFTIHQITTMASIVELEAGNASYENKQKVSAVFFNRLAWKNEPNLLGSSPTAEYPYGDGKYNTNKYPGLPPGPLCSPGLIAIKAAVEPMPNFSACYFVTDKNREFYYRNTYSEHLAIIAELKSKGLWS